jgi:hypothetical protein
MRGRNLSADSVAGMDGSGLGAPLLHSGPRAVNPGCLRAEPSFSENDPARALPRGGNGEFRLVAGLSFRAKR